MDMMLVLASVCERTCFEYCSLQRQRVSELSLCRVVLEFVQPAFERWVWSYLVKAHSTGTHHEAMLLYRKDMI